MGEGNETRRERWWRKKRRSEGDWEKMGKKMNKKRGKDK
jgi:hypothetical protein